MRIYMQEEAGRIIFATYPITKAGVKTIRPRMNAKAFKIKVERFFANNAKARKIWFECRFKTDKGWIGGGDYGFPYDEAYEIANDLVDEWVENVIKFRGLNNRTAESYIYFEV